MEISTVYSIDHPLDFNEPRDEELVLGQELADTIKAFGKKQRESLFHLCIIAYGIRQKNLMKATKRGGNQRGQSYKQQFKAWYEQYQISQVYGNLSNFTLYCMAGRLLHYTRWQKGEVYVDRLPSSLGALYALSTVVWDQGESATDKSRQDFHELLITPVRDGTQNNTFITPSDTRKEIEAKIGKGNKNKLPAAETTEEAGTDFTLHLASIKVHQGLVKFNKRGTKRTIPGPDLGEAKELLNEINQLLQRYGVENFIIDSNIEALEDEYNENQSPDYAKNI